MTDDYHRLIALYYALRYADAVIVIWILVCAAASAACDFSGFCREYSEYIHTELFVSCSMPLMLLVLQKIVRHRILKIIDKNNDDEH